MSNRSVSRGWVITRKLPDISLQFLKFGVSRINPCSEGKCIIYFKKGLLGDI